MRTIDKPNHVDLTIRSTRAPVVGGIVDVVRHQRVAELLTELVLEVGGIDASQIQYEPAWFAVTPGDRHEQLDAI